MLNKNSPGLLLFSILTTVSVERCYGIVIIIDYQLQILLHFSSTAEIELCKYFIHIFILFARNYLIISWFLLYPQKSTHSILLTASTHQNSTQKRIQITKKNTKSPVWKYFGFTSDEDGKPTNYFNPRCKLCSKDILAKFSNTSNLLKHLRLHH